jgi:hypothetical protein
MGSAWGQFVPSGTIVSIDTVTAEPGSSFAVNVRMSNNGLDIAGLQIPLKFTSPYLTVDSVSFVGSVKPPSSQAVVSVDNTADTLSISVFPGYAPAPFPTISTASGVIATIHFTLSGSAPDGIIPIDTIYSGLGNLRWTGVGFTDPTGMGIYLPASVNGGAVVVASPTAIDERGNLIPENFGLAQNYPNPFNPTTTIEFSLPSAGLVQLQVFNVLGQNIATLIERPLSAGTHRVEFDASAQPSGIYFYRLTHPAGSQTEKMVLLK